MRRTGIFLILGLLVPGAYLEMYQREPWRRLMTPFARLSANVKNNHGDLSPNDVKHLEALKRDILEDCASGKLIEYQGQQLYTLPGPEVIPTKPYLLNIDKSVTGDSIYWVLPVVDCNNAALTGSAKPAFSQTQGLKSPPTGVAYNPNGYGKPTTTPNLILSGKNNQNVVLIAPSHHVPAPHQPEYSGEDVSYGSQHPSSTSSHPQYSRPNQQSPDSEDYSDYEDSSDHDHPGKQGVKLAGDGDIADYIYMVRKRITKEVEVTGITMAGVKRPPKLEGMETR